MQFQSLLPQQFHTEIFPHIPQIPSSIPRIHVTELTVLRITINGFYDGDLAGILEYRGKTYYFQICDGTSWYGYGDEIPNFTENFYRRYLIFEASEDMLDEENYWFNLFNREVPKHMSKVEFYDSYDFEDFETIFHQSLLNFNVIGWFEVKSSSELSTKN